MKPSCVLALLLAVISIAVPLSCVAKPGMPSEPLSSVPTQAANSNSTKDSTGAGLNISLPPAGIERRDFAFRLQRVSGRLFADYSVTVLGDRSVTLIASLNSKLESCCDIIKRTRMSRNDYDALVEQVDAMKFYDLQNYYGYGSFHANTVITSVLGPYGSHSVERSNIPCESRFRSLGLGAATPSPPTPTIPRIKRPIDTEPNPLAGKTPPPDSLCKLELMIDHMTGADRLGEEFKAVRDVY
jgi:hypothetical protein